VRERKKTTPPIGVPSDAQSHLKLPSPQRSKMNKGLDSGSISLC
jgi:hypothetical protein